MNESQLPDLSSSESSKLSSQLSSPAGSEYGQHESDVDKQELLEYSEDIDQNVESGNQDLIHVPDSQGELAIQEDEESQYDHIMTG